MPLPGTGIFHPRWSQHHRPSIGTAMTAVCAITRDGGAGWLDDGGVWHPADPTSVYGGPCRVVPLPTDERVAVIGDTQVTTRRYSVAITYAAAYNSGVELAVGDLVTITECPADAGLVGLGLRVTDARYASQTWDRDLTCEEVLPDG